MKPSGTAGKHHEDRHARDSELEFKIVARRNRLLGLWAADKLGLSGEDAQAYAKEVIKADFEEPGDEDVIRKIMKDFAERNVPVEEEQVRRGIVELLSIAREEVIAEQ